MAKPLKGNALACAVARKLHSLEKTSAAWDLRFVDAGTGWAKASMVVREDMLNGLHTAHGGMIFALADTAFAWACNSRNIATFAQQASIAFLSPARVGETLTAEAREEGVNGRSGVYSVKVTGEDRRTVAIFQGLSRATGKPAIEGEDVTNG